MATRQEQACVHCGEDGLLNGQQNRSFGTIGATNRADFSGHKRPDNVMNLPRGQEDRDELPDQSRLPTIGEAPAIASRCFVSVRSRCSEPPDAVNSGCYMPRLSHRIIFNGSDGSGRRICRTGMDIQIIWAAGLEFVACG